jgi:HEPN domain-containing protein
MTDNIQQTAVDFIFDELASKNLLGIFTYEQFKQIEEILNQAKEMEKERMKGMYVEGSFAKMRYYDGLEYIDAEQYYNETYGGGEQ